jgi:UDP-N-acetylmuramate dehydrogenase
VTPGIPVDDLVKFALSVNLTGLEFLNRLPGSVGGALYMNARCYDSEISHVLSWAEYLDEKNQIKILNCHREEWNYKNLPFKGMIGLYSELPFTCQRVRKNP